MGLLVLNLTLLLTAGYTHEVDPWTLPTQFGRQTLQEEAQPHQQEEHIDAQNEEEEDPLEARRERVVS